MKAIFSVDVEPDLHTNSYTGITRGIQEIVKLLDKHKIKATFFVTCDCIERYPKIFRQLLKRGHEIALHGYRHERFDYLTLEQKKDLIKKSIFCFKKYLNIKPKGFRAPQHSVDNETLDLLEEHGFEYDSSLTPINLMLFRHLAKKNSSKISIIKNFFSRIKPYKIRKNLVEIPRTSFLVSIGGFELKVYPKITYKIIISLFKLFKIPFVFVMHSWDVIKVQNSLTSKICPPPRFQKKLDFFLDYSRRRLDYKKMYELCQKIKNAK